MQQPKILVTSAAGRTGSVAVQDLLSKGFPVRAFVRSRDSRANALEAAGAELFTGDLFDFRDLRRAMTGIQRAYHVPPMAPNLLHGAMVFALAAEEAKLEVVALMSQWNPHPSDPSLISREHWITNELFRWMPSVEVIHINPGFFAFPYMLGYPAIVHMGVFMAPFGNGKNAPPSNEDVAHVASAALMNPREHIGKSYRPTGPELLTPTDVADVFSSVVGRKVKYQDASKKMFMKAAKALSVTDFETSQILHYADAVRAGTYELGAPTNHVELVTGKKPESFEDTTRRYFADPTSIHPSFGTGGKMAALAFMARMLMSPTKDFDRWERKRGHVILKAPTPATESQEWIESASKEELFLLPSTAKNGSISPQAGVVERRISV